jgi:oxygen-independent coproporphyrinogen-3 oxidase
LYIHVPFCVRKCAYCDFYSLPGQAELIEQYVAAVLEEGRGYGGMSFNTLYLGGGTPSLLGADNLKKLLGGLKLLFDLSGLTEATIEVNPDSATPALLAAAVKSGINRVSVGVQSLADRELTGVGRVHDTAQALAALQRVTEAGFRAVSADLIIGLPGQSRETLHNSLETLAGQGIEHLSIYCLSLETGTPLAAQPPDDLPSDDAQADLYEAASIYLAERGFVHYEVSNFARPGRECRHNLNYWRGGEYLGLGPAAASHLAGRRWNNRADLHAYLAAPATLKENAEMLIPPEKAAEEAMLRLRLLAEGLDIDALAGRFGRDNVAGLAGRLDRLTAGGGLLRRDGIYRLAPSKVLTANSVFASVLAD